MSGRPEIRSSAVVSPLGLRAFHVIIFLGFAAATVAGTLPELRQLFEALSQPWHFGTPPSVPAVTAGLAATGLSCTLLVLLVRGRSAPLWMSGVMLAAFATSIWQQGYLFSRRSVAGANLAMLEVGTGLHEKMRARLQQTGAVATNAAEWEVALRAFEAENPQLDSPFHDRFFSTVGWQVRTLVKDGDFLLDAAPGTFTVFVPPDASRFTITMVGLDPEHQTVRLRDDLGHPFELRGAYTPDTRN